MREFKKGDKVRVVKASPLGKDSYKNGDIIIVREPFHVAEDGFYSDKGECGIYRSEIEHVNEFKQGQEIEVRYNFETEWKTKRFYVGMRRNGKYVAEHDNTTYSYDHARPIQKPLQLTLEQVAEKFEVESVEIVK